VTPSAQTATFYLIFASTVMLPPIVSSVSPQTVSKYVSACPASVKTPTDSAFRTTAMPTPSAPTVSLSSEDPFASAALLPPEENLSYLNRTVSVALDSSIEMVFVLNAAQDVADVTMIPCADNAWLAPLTTTMELADALLHSSLPLNPSVSVNSVLNTALLALLLQSAPHAELTLRS